MEGIQISGFTNVNTKRIQGLQLSGFFNYSWNVTVSDITDEYGAKVTPGIAPWSVYDKTNGNINVKMYPGITAGIRL
ncbi:MAG: hypothetical protein H8E51_06710 [Bacteroidetes bacterium]|nr:hypothetical protein [Bacteroidota bacterium]